ncbi:MAG: M48 family metallopeptidase [Acidobacteria bacterium]|nr:M48 family metallopeptidase [Acidobacteriota bacterium]
MAVTATHTMDFFERQDQARRTTRRLIAYFMLAVILIILSIYIAGITIFFGFNVNTDPELPFKWWNPDLFLWITGATVCVVVIGSLYKIFALSQGGEVVARWLGGRLIDSNTSDSQERRLLNVVEEMAIASGTPVPSVFLLEEERSINAFAAGFTPADAVIGVTRGTLQILSREELQGVIAHEFSHILNGDMRLNIRLIGVLNGILVIAMIGYAILRSTRTSSSKKNGGAAVLAFGVALLIIGYVGVFFGKFIKSAVSRQREFLADASAVQFTRDPDGIAGALKKIGGLANGSRIKSPKAEEMSHLFFSDGRHGKAPPLLSMRSHKATSAFSFMATHPPLETRIQRIDPSFDGRFPTVHFPSKEALETRDQKKLAASAAQAAAKPTASTPSGGAPAVPLIPMIPQQMTQLFGKLTEAHLAYATLLLAGLPSRLTARVREPSSARIIIFALLLSHDSETRRAQFQLLNESKDPLVSSEATLEASTLIDRCPPEARLPLVDLALPALRTLSLSQYQDFTGLVEKLMKADQKIDLFEFTLQHILRRHLDPHFNQTRPPAARYGSLTPLTHEISLLLSRLARAGQDSEEQAQQAFAQGVKELSGSRLKLSWLEQEDGFEALSNALDRLNRVTPLLKRRLLRACGVCVSHDDQVTLREGELLRAIADALDCPMPPFLAGQPTVGNRQPGPLTR